MFFIICDFFSYSIIVDKIDADQDGFVTEAELKAWIKKAQKKYIYDNVDRQWKDFDMNNDGMISWDEYKNVTYGTYLGKEEGFGNLICYVMSLCNYHVGLFKFW